MSVQKVVHGKYKGSADVAIKMLKEAAMSEKEFVAEAFTMTSVLCGCLSVVINYHISVELPDPTCWLPRTASGP